MKAIIQGMLVLLTFFVVLPMGWVNTYLLFQHIQAPQAMWVIWIIQLPLALVVQILNEMAKRIKD